MSKEAGFELKELNTDLSAQAILREEAAGSASGYFYAEIPVMGGIEQRRFICITPSSSDFRVSGSSEDTGSEKPARCAVPLQFGRAVAANLMGRTELTEWKYCVLSEDEEAKLAYAFRASLSKYE